MGESRSFEYARFAALLPELTAVVLRRERSPARIASAGVRLGGLLAWGVEQARFSGELTGPDLAEACQSVPFPPVHPVPVRDFRVDAAAYQHSAAVGSFNVVDQYGAALELLVSRRAVQKAITADGLIAHRLVRLIHSTPKRMSAADLSDLLRLVARMAATEADLSEEAEGLRLAAGTRWLQAPSVVLQGEEFLLETALEGVRADDLSAPNREAAYPRAVLNWAWMLAEDGILHSFLRRDQIRFDGDRVGVSRWAGTYRPGPAVQALVPALAQAAFGPAAGRARQRSRLLGLLAHGLGAGGSLENLADLCLALVSQSGSLQLTRPLMPDLRICQQQGAAPDRMGLMRFLRQLVWFRDLGLACGVADLAAPWRELADEAEPRL